jgi:hypothetical protein
MSAMTTDAIEDELCEANVWLRLGVKRNDPRVQKRPRPKRIWTMDDMHAFAATAARVRDPERKQVRLERWRATYAEPMILLLSDCGLRFGELLAVERNGLRPGWLRVKTVAYDGELIDGTKTTHHKPEDEQWRDIPLPPSTEAKLRALPPRIDTPLMFTTPTGKTWRERNWRRDVWARPPARRWASTRGRRSSEPRGSRSCAPPASTQPTWPTTPATVWRRRTRATSRGSDAAPSR